MTDHRAELAAAIQHNRPKISGSSITTYVSCLANLAKKMDGSPTKAWFEGHDEAILKFLADKPARSRKTTLSALFVLTDYDRFRQQMLADCKTVADDYKKQERDPREVAAWMTIPEIRSIYETLRSKAVAMLSNKTPIDFGLIMQFWLVAFLGAGVGGIVPRRSLDYALLKTKDFNKDTDNFYSKGKMVFNRYKTAYKFGRQEVTLPPELDKLAKKWIKINPTDSFLFSSNMHPLTSTQIARTLNKAFGKPASVDAMRHIFLTDKYQHMPAISEMERLADEMGHSTQQALLYVKKS